MRDEKITVNSSDILDYGLACAVALAWLQQFPVCGNFTLLPAWQKQNLDMLTGCDALTQLMNEGLIIATQTLAGWSIELLAQASQLDPECVRELKQHGLTTDVIEEAYRVFTVGVHRDPTTLDAENYRALPIAGLGISKAFVRFAILYNSIHRSAPPEVAPHGAWSPQIKTIQILVTGGIPKTFVHEKIIEFQDSLGISTHRRGPSVDHSFIAYCRKAWLNADGQRRAMEIELSR